MKKSGRKHASDFILGGALILIASSMVLPFMHLLSVSISEPMYVTRGLVTLMPRGFYLEVYKAIFSTKAFGVAFLNSVIYTAVGTAINLVMTCMCAYPLNKQFPFKRVFLTMMVITMFFGGGMIPSFMLISRLKLLDTIWALVLPGSISAFYAFIMRTYFKTIGDEIEDAARIDGCNDIDMLFRIMVPLSKPIFATLALFYGVNHWNNYFAPMLYLSSQSKYPLQLYLRDLLVAQTEISAIDAEMFTKYRKAFNPVQFRYGTILVSILPILVAYPFLQKHFTKGFMVGAIKG